MKVLRRLTTTAAVPLHRISTFSVGNDNDDIRINLYYDHKEDTLECYCVGSLASKIFKKNSSTPLFSVKDSREDIAKSAGLKFGIKGLENYL